MNTETGLRVTLVYLSVVAAFLAPTLMGQDSTFTTLAGRDESPGAVDGKGAAARFNWASGVARDAAGNLYVADSGNHTIRKVNPDGSVTTLAGLAGNPGTNDGTGVAARFNFPYAIAVDSAGNVFVADGANFTIRRLTPSGTVTTLAGKAGQAGTNDGPGIEARFGDPGIAALGVAVGTAGDVFVADAGNSTIRRIDSTGMVTTYAGLAGNSGTNDGPRDMARFNYPNGVAVDSVGNVFVADTGSSTIRMITPTGEVTTLAGSPGVYGSADGTASEARFSGPYGLTVDHLGNVYVADAGNNTIRKLTPDGSVSTLAGLAGYRGNTDGSGSEARFYFPRGIVADAAGNLYVADLDTASTGAYGAISTIRHVTSEGVVTTFVGQPAAKGYADGVGSEAQFYYPLGVAVDASGTAYVTDNGTVRQVTPDGMVTTLGTAGWFDRPWGVALDRDGNFYVAEYNGQTIRKITPAWEITTLAGLAGSLGSANGTGSAARFRYPQGVAVDTSSGNVYVADSGNHTIRKITPAGAVTTLAGSAGRSGSADGTGSAARFNFPYDVAVDHLGNVYVADTYNYTIRKVTPQGVVTTFAGVAGSGGIL